jgi:protein-S-isoprenylcysteine O-methyltransferase Ste14
MWPRAIGGVVLCFIGGVWFTQGIGVAKGSAMTGHSGYAVLGLVLVAAGVALLVWAMRVRRATSGPSTSDPSTGERTS